MRQNIAKYRKTAIAVYLVIMGLFASECNAKQSPHTTQGAVSMPIDKELKKYYDKHPNKITKDDIAILKKFNDLAYTLTEKEHKEIRVDLIYDYIIRHKAYRHKYNKFKLTTTLDVGSKTRSTYTEGIDYDTIESKEYYNASVKLTYPLYDDKTEAKIRNDKLKYNLSLIDKIKEYAEKYEDMIEYTEEVKFLRLKQRVWKGEELSGVKYRDEWITLLDKLRTANSNLRKARATVRALRVYLLNLTTKPDGLIKLL